MHKRSDSEFFTLLEILKEILMAVYLVVLFL